jgi:hypothetical protein
VLNAACAGAGGGGDDGGGFNNTTDPANGGADYVGAAACSACHSSFAQRHTLHGHAYALTPIEGQPPVFPDAAALAGVPDPPARYTWNDISLVIGGYRHLALFADLDGYVLTTGVTGTDTQWNIAEPATGAAAGFVPYRPEEAAPLPLGYDTLRRRATGAQPFDSRSGVRQDNRPGIDGTWHEPGVQCESCHGPGSRHVSNPQARDLFVDGSGDASCNLCHSLGFGGNERTILASGGFIISDQENAELRASGGHAEFACQFCHEPHSSVTYDRPQAMRNECTACHSGQNMARHEARTFVFGDYVEPLTCASCHMPRAARVATSRVVEAMDQGMPLGAAGRIGDARSHIVRISLEPNDYTAMFTPDGTQVRVDEQGRGALTVDFVCLRCHHGEGGVFGLSIDRAVEIAAQLHGPQ